MAQPVAFNEENLVLHAPPPYTCEQIEALPVYMGLDGSGTPVIVSCFKITKEEFELLKTNGGRLYLTVMGTMMPPVRLEAESPFQYDEKDEE